MNISTIKPDIIMNFNSNNLDKLFEYLIKILKNDCTREIEKRYKNPLTNKISTSFENCAYTSSGLTVLMSLFLLNQQLIKNFTEYSYPIALILPNTLKIINSDDEFYLGIINTIGLLWDKHEELTLPFVPCGINYALNDSVLQKSWFNTNLEPGINILTFHCYDNNKYVTIHHSFVYVHDNLCYLIDSWNDDKFRRDLLIRKYELEEFKKYLNLLNTPFLPKIEINDVFNKKLDSERFNIMTTVFLSPPNNSIHKTMKWIILKKNIINELIIKGFNERECLFGGSKQNNTELYKNKYFKYKKKYLKLKIQV